MASTVRMMPLRRLRLAAGAATSTPSAPVLGFVLERGRYTPVAIPPHLAATAPQGIVPMGINDRRQMAGEYEDPDGVGHGFLLDRGRYTAFDAPGATVTVPFGLNDRGQLVGVYENAAAQPTPQPTPTLPMGGMF